MFKEINNVVFNVNNITKIFIDGKQVVIFTNDQDVTRIDLEKEPHENLIYNIRSCLEVKDIEGFLLNEMNDFLYEEEND